MRVVEEDPRLPAWLNGLLNSRFLCLDANAVKTRAIALDNEGIWFPPATSLFFNGQFIRVCWPFGFFIGIRWSSSMTKKAFWQGGIGFAINGRFKLTFRIQSDVKAAQGTLGPNVGQATGFSRGPH